jgi:hypothetical protein
MSNTRIGITPVWDYCGTCGRKSEHLVRVVGVFNEKQCKTCNKIIRIFKLNQSRKRPIRKLSDSFIRDNFTHLAKIKGILEKAGIVGGDVIKRSKALNQSMRGMPDLMRLYNIDFCYEAFGNEAICIVSGKPVSMAYLTEQNIDTSKQVLTDDDRRIANELGSRYALAITFTREELESLDFRNNFHHLARNHLRTALEGIQQALTLDSSQADLAYETIKKITFRQIGLFKKRKLSQRSMIGNDEMYYRCHLLCTYTNFIANYMLRKLNRCNNPIYSYYDKVQDLLVNVATNHSLNDLWVRSLYADIAYLKKLIKYVAANKQIIETITELKLMQIESSPLMDVRLEMLETIALVAERFDEPISENEITSYTEEEGSVNCGEFQTDEGVILTFAIGLDGLLMETIDMAGNIVKIEH